MITLTERNIFYRFFAKNVLTLGLRKPKGRVFWIVLFLFFYSSSSYAQFTITENFKGSSVGSNIILGGDPSATLTSGVSDPINNGWLRLTTDATNQRGYAYINTPFTPDLGLYIEFEYKTWRSKNDNTYNGADGISVFLFDATKTFSVGAFGGSLGYANQNTSPGLVGGYLGIGLDEYGNFAMASEGKNGGTSALAPNSIVLRGPANHAQPYRYLTSVQLQTNPSNNTNSIDYNTTTSTRPTDATFFRRVKIYIDPIGTIANPKYRIRVLWRTTPTGGDTQLIQYDTTDPIPAKLKMGFAASTGGGFNYHEIRNVYITTTGGMHVSKEVDKPNAIPTDNLTYTLNISNDTNTNLSNVVINDTIKDGNGIPINLSDFQITSITFNNNGNANNTATGYTSGVAKTSGFTNPFSATLSVAGQSYASFTVVGKINTMPAGGILKNSVGLNVSGSGLTDPDMTNNYATVSTTVLNPNTDLKIEKGVDNNGIARQSGNTYTIVVSNVSTNSKPASQAVTVTDAIPAGFTVTSATGTGWTITNSGNSYTFARSDALNSMYSYPAITINVTPSGTGPWTNTANLSYQYDTNSANNSSSAVLHWPNYWRGNTDTDWSKSGNWTGNIIPGGGENIEFATTANNGGANGNGAGAAVNDLYLDQDRVIGYLINASDKNLVVTAGKQLTINGVVQDGNSSAGTIIVKSDPSNPTGTLLFANPGNNPNVGATVEFYNKGYQCQTCGYYKQQWQYFGIPVASAAFPTTGAETVNQYVEPWNGNKWRPAPYTPDTQLKAFKGYEITNSGTSVPTNKYNFAGTLNTSDATLTLTKTNGVNYSGMNLFSNSYTGALPISSSAITGTGYINATVYLFNAGTRDQWRKLSGNTVTGVESGRYLAVPFNQAGQGGLPDRIPSMQSFMLLSAAGGGTATLKYNQLTKNTLVNGVAWRSTESVDSMAAQHSGIIIEVIGSRSADRLWLFEETGTTRGFDNGWDAYKIDESPLIGIYGRDDNEGKYQVMTVPEFEGTKIGITKEDNTGYTIGMKVTSEVSVRGLYLTDRLTGRSYPITDGAEYRITGTNVSEENRFEITASATTATKQAMAGGEIRITVTDGAIVMDNGTNDNCKVSLIDITGRTTANVMLPSLTTKYYTDISSLQKGVYIVKVLNEKGQVVKTERALIK